MFRLGNWLLPDQAMALLEAPDPETMKGKRDLALLAILVACGLRRHEAVELNVSDLQQREDHWAIVAVALPLNRGLRWKDFQ